MPQRTSVKDLNAVLESVVPPTRLVANGKPIIHGEVLDTPTNEHELKRNMDALDDSMVSDTLLLLICSYMVTKIIFGVKRCSQVLTTLVSVPLRRFIRTL